MYAEELKVKKAYDGVALFSGNRYKVRNMAETEPTGMYASDSLTNPVANSNFINAVFIKS